MKYHNSTKILKWALVLCQLSLCTLQIKAQTVIFENGAPSAGIEFGNSILEAPDGSLIVVGSTTTDTEGLSDIEVTKLTADGSELWSVTHGGFNNDFPASAVMLSDGSFVILGTTGSFTDSPSRDVYLLKMDSEGDILWTHSFGGSQTDEGTDIKETPEGDFIITAFTQSFGEGETDGWLLKTDSQGNLLWDQTFGGVGIEILAGVDVALDGGYILTGGTRSFAGEMEDDIWLIKTDSNGNEIWSQTFGVANGIDSGADVATAADGYVAVGISDNDPSNPPALSGEGLFMKVDLNGNLLWDQSIAGNFRVEGFGVYPSQDDGWFICGTKVESPSVAHFWVAKADALGEILWEVELGQPSTVSFAFDVIQTGNGDVVATGLSGLTQSSTQDMHVLRLSDETLSVSERPQTIEFAAMPNPTQGSLSVVLSKNHADCMVLVTDAAGKMVKSQNFENNEPVEINLSGLNPGMYLLRVLTAEGVGTRRIVKY